MTTTAEIAESFSASSSFDVKEMFEDVYNGRIDSLDFISHSFVCSGGAPFEIRVKVSHGGNPGIKMFHAKTWNEKKAFGWYGALRKIAHGG